MFLDAVADVNYTFAVPRTAPGIGLSFPNGDGCDASFQETHMAKINFTLKNIARDIKKAEKELRAIRGKVVEGDKKTIELELRGLEKCSRIIEFACGPFGHVFTTKTKAKAKAKARARARVK